MVKIIAIPKDILPDAWKDASPFIQKALDKSGGEMAIKDVYNWILDDKYILLMAVDEKPMAAVVLEIQDYPQKKRIGVPFIGGVDMKKWFTPMIETIRRIAKEAGAESIIGQGRDGWARYMNTEVISKHTVVEVAL